MDKNTIVGLVLIGAVLIGWGYLTKPTPEQIERSRQMRDSIQLVNQARSVEALRNEQEIKTNQIISEPKAENASNEAQMGSFDVAQTGVNEFYTIENEKLKVIISKRGGRPYSVQLKEFQTFDSLPLYIFN
ncbi:MAG: membrane protein insertase YidC, partial [Salinivirgaceae bacterium]|nr:membrane protein insertase YidC [Salinivirgaceae bacterium]